MHHAVVLAGAFGWGSPAAFGFPPRPLAHVGFRPLISYTLDWLADGGVAESRICALERAEPVRAALGERHRGMALSYLEDPMPRGPAGCVRDALLQSAASTVVVVEGSLLPELDFSALTAHHAISRSAMTVAAMADPQAPGALRPSGIYVMEREAALAHIPAGGFQDLKETLIPRLHRAGAKISVFEHTQPCHRVSNLETYLAANYLMISRLGSTAPVTTTASVVAPDVRFIGPVMLGAGSRIDAGATIVGPAAIGPGAHVMSGALVSRSVVGAQCRIGHGAIVHGSVVAAGATVQAGAQVLRTLAPSESPQGWLARLAGRRAGHSVPEPVVAPATLTEPTAYPLRPAAAPASAAGRNH